MNDYDKLFSNNLNDDEMGILGAQKGMMSGAERALLYNAARYYYDGKGVIVDAGCFIGLSTLCLAMGLERNGAVKKAGEAIQTYDFFKVWTEHAFPYLPEGYKVGDSFLSVFEETIKDHKDKVKVYDGDLMTQKRLNKPIEILFLDVCKSWALERQTRQIFFPDLQVGSLLIQQDFFVHEGPWISLAYHKMQDYLKFVRKVETSAVFEVVKEIPEDACQFDLQEHSFEELSVMMDEITKIYEKIDPLPLILSRAQVIYQYHSKLHAISYILNVFRSLNLEHTNQHVVRAIDAIGFHDNEV